MNCLVLGGTRFMGRHLVEALLGFSFTPLADWVYTLIDFCMETATGKEENA